MSKTGFSNICKIFESADRCLVACSGGVDSLLLSYIVSNISKCDVKIFHAIGPAVPKAATARVFEYARTYGWNLQTADAREFFDPQYRENPLNRCYFCKTHLYKTMRKIADSECLLLGEKVDIFSGTNLDDLNEYRPGLNAASEWGVRHPFVEAGIGKEEIRAISREYSLPFWNLPASPCLASRIYTGTEVTEDRLRAVEQSESVLRELLPLQVVRCRIEGNSMRVEVPEEFQHLVTATVLSVLRNRASSIFPLLADVSLDLLPYRAGRAFVREL